MKIVSLLIAAMGFFVSAQACAENLRGTGDLEVVIERAAGSVLIVDTSARKTLGRVSGLGDLSHASAVFSQDQRFAYLFGRDGGLSKIDLFDRIHRRPDRTGGQRDRRRHFG